MNDLPTKETLFYEIALAHLRGREVTIDEEREIFEAQGFWAEDDLAKAERDRLSKNAELRRLNRKPFFDEDGNRQELVNIKRPKAAPSERQQFFVFINDVTQEDFEWLIEDRIKKRSYFTSEIVRYLGIYQQRFGKNARSVFQRRLHLDFDA